MSLAEEGAAAPLVASPEQAADRPTWFLLGLFLTTFLTLCLEVLDSRLLSVMTWYQLSFFAVSTALFGMAAGALRVYLRGAALAGAAAPRALVRYTTWLAAAIPACHVVNLVIPLPNTISLAVAAAFLVSTIALAVPFYLSGVVVTIALTRMPTATGLTYAVDLAGAALGSLAVIPILETTDVTTGAVLCGALAAVAALSFARHAGHPWPRLPAATAALLGTAVIVLASTGGSGLIWVKGGERVVRAELLGEYWNLHSRVAVHLPWRTAPSYWGPGEGAMRYQARNLTLDIDGGAATALTEWDGDAASLAWVEHDVTALPYALRQGGDVAVIGVGGGRDLLTALRSRARSVIGVELNSILLRLLREDFRDTARLADHPDVTLIHDEARSYLTRTERRFDVLQMSLIDTWAATAAGAMTLSENGLYTLEAWAVFLRVLKPHGLFSVSRWYAPDSASETSRLLALGVAALLERGASEPRRQLALVARHNVATLIASPSPLDDDDTRAIVATAARFGFTVLAAPAVTPADPMLAAIQGATSAATLAAATAHELYDFTPPRDDRPFFFNMLRPGHAFSRALLGHGGGVIGGNLVATSTLVALVAVSTLLVAIAILGPLIASGLPAMTAPSFAHAIAYFTAIGAGFMLVQIAFMQRFSVFLGHPTYAVVVVLAAMILVAGLGSLVSDRLPVTGARTPATLALAITGTLAVIAAVLTPILSGTIQLDLLARATVVLAIVTPVALLLGMALPLGLRLVRALSDSALPWMWGVNGAASVFGAASAVFISMFFGIGASLRTAAILYATVAITGPALARAVGRDGRRARD